MVETLVLLYEEIKNKGIKLPEKDRKKLEMLQPFADLEDFEGEGSEWVTSTTSILVSLFKSLTKELRATGYSAVILHYNNLDKIKDEEKILNLFQEIREFLQNPDSIMIFIGDDLAHNAISSEPRIKQIFQFPAIEVRPLSYEETREIIEKRIELLRIDKSRDVKVLEEGVIRILWNLFKGNIREILNSLSFTFRELPQGNLPVTITNLRLKDVLHEAVNRTTSTN